MRTLYLALMLLCYLIIIPYTRSRFGIGSFEILMISLLATPGVAPKIRSQDLGVLGIIWGTALAATLVAMLSYPGVRVEYFKTLFIFGISLAGSYVAFLTVRSLSRRTISSMCLICTLAALFLGTAETFIPSVRAFSMQLSAKITPADGISAAGEEWLERQDSRDVLEAGGRPRPILGAVEPGRIATFLAVVLTGWNLTRLRTTTNDALLIFLFCYSILLTRSPTFLAIFAAGNTVQFLRDLASRNAFAIVTAFTMVAGVVVFGALTATRMEKLARGEDNSINERIVLPFLLTKIANRETYGLGLGFVGAYLEPDRKELDVFSPMVIEALEGANHLALYQRGFFMGRSISIGHAGFATHFTFHGIYFGLFSLLMWRWFTRLYRPDLFFSFFMIFLCVGLSGYYYETLAFWTIVMIFLGFASVGMRYDYGAIEDDHFEFS